MGPGPGPIGLTCISMYLYNVCIFMHTHNPDFVLIKKKTAPPLPPYAIKKPHWNKKPPPPACSGPSIFDDVR